MSKTVQVVFSEVVDLESTRVRTKEGFLKVGASIARTGIQEYRPQDIKVSSPKEKVRIYRSPDQVFSEDSMDTFGSKPITNNHPPSLLSSDNAKQYVVGMSDKSIQRDGELMRANLTFIDKDTIDRINSGKVQLSNGYTADIEMSPGITESGEEYDGIQKNILGNHIALVEKGRAGTVCRLDDSGLETEDKNAMNENTQSIMINDAAYQVPNEIVPAIQQLKENFSAALNDNWDLEERFEKFAELTHEAEEISDAQIEALVDHQPTEDDIDDLVSERMSIVDAATLINPNIECEGASNEEIILDTLQFANPTIDLENEDADYLMARFHVLVEDAFSNVPTPMNPISKVLSDGVSNPIQVQDNRPADVIARERFMNDSRNAWNPNHKTQAGGIA